DHFLSLDPTSLTVDQLEQHLLAAETSAVAIAAARGTPCTPFFEGCSPSPLAPSYASAATVDVLSTEDVGAASAHAKRRSSKGKRGWGGGGGSGGGGGGSSGGSRGSGGGGSGGSGGGSGGVGGGDRGSSGSGGSGSGGSGGGRSGAQRGGSGGGERQRHQRIDAAALGAGESSLPGTAPAEALHTFTLDSGASRCFFRDSTTLPPLLALVPVRLADPSGGPVVARSSTVLTCPAVPSGSLSGLHLPSFSMNLVSTAALQDTIVTTTTPGGQVASPCSSHLLLHQTLLWHNRLGHPSLPRLHGMHSRSLVSGLPRSLPPLPPSPAPPCLPCVEGRQRAAPHSSSFPPTTAPLQTLYMDVWGPARVSGQGRERYFLLVIDDYTRYTTVFPLRSKGQVGDVLFPWIRSVHLQLRERFRADLPILRLHSDRGGEFSSNLLQDFCHGEGILQSFTLPDSPQQNGIVERRIGLVMEVARTSMIHVAAPRFLWPFAVRYAAHQLNLWPRVSFSETSLTLRWTGKVGDASVFRGAAPLGVSHVDPLPGTAPVEVAVGSGAARGAASGGAASRGAEPGVAESESAASGGAEPGGEEPGGAEPVGVERGGAEPEGVEPEGAESEGAESGGAEPRGAASSGGPAGALPRLSLQQSREWLVRRARLRSGAIGAGAAGAGGAGVTAGAGETEPEPRLKV
ncbi:unnamed protein product, partial [Closterium sp. NIES-53]